MQIVAYLKYHVKLLPKTFESVHLKMSLGIVNTVNLLLGYTGGSEGKESTCNMGDLGSIPGLRKSPGEGNSYPLQYSGLEN